MWSAGCAVRDEAKLLILSITRDESCVMDALAQGPTLLLKDGPFRHVLDALSFIRDGGVYVSPLLRGAGLFTKPERTVEDPLTTLSPREDGSVLLPRKRTPG